MNPVNDASSPALADVFLQRRRRLLAKLRAHGGGVALLAAAPETLRNRDSDYLYRQDSYFYYLSGFIEPEAFLVLDADAEPGEPSAILFCRPKNPER
jgi:Xaa-Pro aminopeptidase